MFDTLKQIEANLPQLIKDRTSWYGIFDQHGKIRKACAWRAINSGKHLALQMFEGDEPSPLVCSSPGIIRVIKGVAELGMVVDFSDGKTSVATSILAAGSMVHMKDDCLFYNLRPVSGRILVLKIQDASENNDYSKGKMLDQSNFDWLLKQFEAIYC